MTNMSRASQPARTSLATAGTLARVRPRRPVLQHLRRDRTALVGIALVVTLLLVAAAAPLVAPHDPTAVNSLAIMQTSSREHLLGTDYLGRDMLSRLIHGARWTLSLALIATAAIVAIGVIVGLIAGYFGGWVDDLLMRIVDVLLAFPSLILALAIVGMLGPGLRNVLIGMIAVWWASYARIIRSITLSLRDRDYITAASCCGCSDWRIILRHLFPNVIPSIIVLASLEIGALMLALSSLSFLGLGAQPPTPEWGTMLNDGRVFFSSAPRMMIYPGVAMTITVMAFNLLGDGLRDALDPRLKPTR